MTSAILIETGRIGKSGAMPASLAELYSPASKRVNETDPADARLLSYKTAPSGSPNMALNRSKDRTRPRRRAFRTERRPAEARCLATNSEHQTVLAAMDEGVASWNRVKP